MFLLCVLQFVCCCLCCFASSPRFWSCVPLCCAISAVVRVTFAPSVRLYLVFCCVSWCFFEVVLSVFLYFSPLLPLWCRVFPVLVVCWCGVLVLWSVGCCVVGVVCLMLFVCVCFLFGLFGCVALSEILLGVLLLRVWLVCVASGCSLCCSSVGSILFWVVRCFVVLLVVARAVRLLVGCVALSAFLLLVLLLVVLLVLLVVGLLVLLSPLFCHDLGCFCSWFNAECHPGWVAVWYFCSVF